MLLKQCHVYHPPVITMSGRLRGACAGKGEGETETRRVLRRWRGWLWFLWVEDSYRITRFDK